MCMLDEETHVYTYHTNVILTLPLHCGQWYWDHWSSETADGGSKAAAWTAWGMNFVIQQLFSWFVQGNAFKN